MKKVEKKEQKTVTVPENVLINTLLAAEASKRIIACQQMSRGLMRMHKKCDRFRREMERERARAESLECECKRLVGIISSKGLLGPQPQPMVKISWDSISTSASIK